jgi:DNA-binding transcriptional ArsR family regulator
MKNKGKVKSLIDRNLVSALSHPVRLHILDALNETTASPSDLAREVGADVNYVAYHVKELEKIGYLELVKTEPRRGAVEHYYRARQRYLIDDREWERLPMAVKDGFSVDIFQSIVSDVREAVEAGTFNVRPERHISRTRLLVDERGWEQANAVLLEAMERIFEIQAECEKRLERSDGEPIPMAVSMLGFETSPRSPATELPATS